MKSTEFWNIDNVVSFNGYDVVNGEIELTDSEFEEILDELYGEVQVCGQTFGSGSLLVDADPTSFSCMKGEYEDNQQADLEDQIDREDSSGIEFIDGDEDDLDNDEEEEGDE